MTVLPYVTCPWCSTSSATNFRWSTRDDDGNWVYICHKCGHEFRNPEPLVIE